MKNLNDAKLASLGIFLNLHISNMAAKWTKFAIYFALYAAFIAYKSGLWIIMCLYIWDMCKKTNYIN